MKRMATLNTIRTTPPTHDTNTMTRTILILLLWVGSTVPALCAQQRIRPTSSQPFDSGLPQSSGTARILGTVFEDGTPPRPLAGAVIDAVLFPSREGAPSIPAPSVTTNAQGQFDFQTHAFLGSISLLVRIRKADHTESLRQVDIMAGRCARVEDAFLTPLSPRVTVGMSGGTVRDRRGSPSTGGAELIVPPNVLQRDMDIAVTVLSSDTQLRERLPGQVSRFGIFVDIDGVFGHETQDPVTLRIPNTYSLPIDTEVPFGKVDHNTLEWSDMREVANQSIPENLGIVKSDGQGGTFIEVQFDHFCSICTGYCLPYDPGVPTDVPGGTGPQCTPSEVFGMSSVSMREGHLRETLDLPSFVELGESLPMRLLYSSHAAAPSYTVSMTMQYPTTRPVEGTVFEFQVEGKSVSAVYSRRNQTENPTGTWIWDGRNGFGDRLPTGSYDVEMIATGLHANAPIALPEVGAFFGAGGPRSRTFPGNYPGLTPLRSDPIHRRAVLINGIDSPFGAGWRFEHEEQLTFDPDGCVVLIRGNSEGYLFLPVPDSTPQRWTLPDGEFGSFIRDGATGDFVREYPNGSIDRFNSAGRLVLKRDRYGYEMHFVYTNGRLVQMRTKTDHTLTFLYDTAGKIRELRDSAGRTTQFTVDAAGNLALVTAATGAPQTFQYDTEHRLIAQIGPRGERTTYLYREGRVIESSSFDVMGGPLLRRRQFEPSALLGEIESSRPAGTLGNPIGLVDGRKDVYFDGRSSRLEHETDTEGRTSLRRDALGREFRIEWGSGTLRTADVMPNGSRTEYDYDANGMQTETRVYTPTRGLYARTTQTRNGPFGAIDSLVDPEGNTILYTHDAVGNVLTVQNAMQETTRFAYQDPRFPSLLTELVRPAGERIQFSYDTHGNILSIVRYQGDPANPTPATATYQNDSAGFVANATDPQGELTSYGRDAFGRITAVTAPSQAAYTIDRFDPTCGCDLPWPRFIRYPNGSFIEYRYDGLGRAIERIDQNGAITRRSFDPEGRMTSVTNRNQETWSQRYDAAGQLIERVLPTGTQLTFAWNELGLMTSASDPFCRLRFDRDFLGRISEAVTFLDIPAGGASAGQVEHRILYSYDRLSNKISSTDDVGQTTYEYDRAYRLSRLLDARGEEYLFGYTSSGKRQFSQAVSAGVTTQYLYDVGGNLTGIATTTTPAVSQSYGPRDLLGNLLSQSLDIGASTLTHMYGYDELSQLTSALSSRPLGNRTALVTSQVDAANRLLSDSEYTYTWDAEGQLRSKEHTTSGTVQAYDYDALGQLTGVQESSPVQGAPMQTMEVQYRYDPLGRRVCKEVNGVQTLYLYDGMKLYRKLARDLTALQSYVRAEGREILGMYDDVEGVMRHFQNNRQGTVVSISDASGVLEIAYDYDEFGNFLLTGNPVGFDQEVGFLGSSWDAETGLSHLGARYYDPSVGRFLSEDPLGIAGGFNLYQYAGNNPVTFFDPTGLKAEDPEDCYDRELQECLDQAVRAPKKYFPILGCLAGAATFVRFAGIYGAIGGCLAGAFIPGLADFTLDAGQSLVGGGPGCKARATIRCGTTKD